MLLVLALGIAFVWLNRSSPIPGLRLALVVGTIGAATNAFVQLVRDGMPFSPEAAVAAGYSATEVATPHFGYVPLGEGDPLGLVLGDVIPVPLLHRVLSVGALVLVIGLVLLTRALAAYARVEKSSTHEATTRTVVRTTSGEEGVG